MRVLKNEVVTVNMESGEEERPSSAARDSDKSRTRKTWAASWEASLPLMCSSTNFSARAIVSLLPSISKLFLSLSSFSLSSFSGFLEMADAGRCLCWRRSAKWGEKKRKFRWRFIGFTIYFLARLFVYLVSLSSRFPFIESSFTLKSSPLVMCRVISYRKL